VIGLVAWAVLLPAALLLRRPPPTTNLAGTAAGGGPAGGGGEGFTARQALGSRQFAVLAATFFACCLAHAGRSSTW
jgi:hypothetical protein